MPGKYSICVTNYLLVTTVSRIGTELFIFLIPRHCAFAWLVGWHLVDV